MVGKKKKNKKRKAEVIRYRVKDEQLSGENEEPKKGTRKRTHPLNISNES